MQDMKKCIEAWKETLRSFGVVRNINLMEETAIARAIKQYGSEFVELALFGARFEKQTKDFNPRDHLSIGRILTRKDGVERIDKFANLGSAQRQIVKTELEAKQKRELPPREEETTCPENVRAILSQLPFMRKMPK